MNDVTNLLPMDYRQREQSYRVARLWFIALAATVMFTSLDGLILYQQGTQIESPLNELRSAAEPLRSLGDRESALVKRKVDLERRWKTIAGVIPNDEMLQTIGAIAAEVCDLGDQQAQLESLYIQLHPAQAKAEPRADIRLCVIDDAVAAKLVQQLGANERLNHVVLRSSVGGKLEGSRIIEVDATPRVEQLVAQPTALLQQTTSSGAAIEGTP